MSAPPSPPPTADVVPRLAFPSRQFLFRVLTGNSNYPTRPCPDAMRWARAFAATCRMRNDSLLRARLVGAQAPDAHARVYHPADYIFMLPCVLRTYCLRCAREREEERIWIFLPFFFCVFFRLCFCLVSRKARVVLPWTCVRVPRALSS